VLPRDLYNEHVRVENDIAKWLDYPEDWREGRDDVDAAERRLYVGRMARIHELLAEFHRRHVRELAAVVGEWLHPTGGRQ